MARRLLSAIADRLRFPEAETVHFHRSGGVAAACYDQRCDRPHLAVDEL